MADALFKVGDRIEAWCPFKAEHGSVGTVLDVLPYGGPRVLDEWEYFTEFDQGFLEGRRVALPERWAIPHAAQKKDDTND